MAVLESVFTSICSYICSYIYIYLIVAALGLCCCTQAFSSCGGRMLPSSCKAQASHCRGFSFRGSPPPACVAVVVLSGLSCSTVRGIFPDQYRTCVSCTGGRSLDHGTTGKSPPRFITIYSISCGSTRNIVVLGVNKKTQPSEEI